LPAAERRSVGRWEVKILEALGNIGDFVGGIAVVVTLIYLAVQVRQNTAALRTASRQEIAAGFRDVNRLNLDPNALRAYGEGLRKYPHMPFDQRGRFSTIIADHALFVQGAFALYEAGQLEEQTYRAYLHFFACHLITPGGAAWWAETGRPFFVGRMVEAVDKRLAEGNLPDITQLAFFNADDFVGGPVLNPSIDSDEA